MEKIKCIREWVQTFAFARAAESWKDSKYVPSRVSYSDTDHLTGGLYLVQRTRTITPNSFKEHKHE